MEAAVLAGLSSKNFDVQPLLLAGVGACRCREMKVAKACGGKAVVTASRSASAIVTAIVLTGALALGALCAMGAVGM
jgi:hypothetical protein